MAFLLAIYRSCIFGLNQVINSIYENQHRSILCRLDHILKLPVSRDGFLQPGRNCRHGFEEAQQKTALHRVIHF